MAEDLGPKPEPKIEPGEPNPGGVDADRNPAVEDEAPDELQQPDDTDTEATTDCASEPTKESPA